MPPHINYSIILSLERQLDLTSWDENVTMSSRLQCLLLYIEITKKTPKNIIPICEFLNAIFERPQDELGLDSLSASFGSRGLDEKTEIILAATFLVLIILAFIR